MLVGAEAMPPQLPPSGTNACPDRDLFLQLPETVNASFKTARSGDSVRNAHVRFYFSKHCQQGSRPVTLAHPCTVGAARVTALEALADEAAAELAGVNARAAAATRQLLGLQARTAAAAAEAEAAIAARAEARTLPGVCVFICLPMLSMLISSAALHVLLDTYLQIARDCLEGAVALH